MPKKGHKNTKKETMSPAEKEAPVSTLAVKVEINQDTKPPDKAVTNTEAQPTPVTENKKYRKRVIHDNWAKYEEVIISEDLTDDSTREDTDFSFLASQASSVSYFQMSNEKEWEKRKLVGENIFQLDVKLLSAGLSCVPLYERIGIDRNNLTEADIERCDYFAEQSKLRYHSLFEEQKRNRATKKDTEVPRKTAEVDDTHLKKGLPLEIPKNVEIKESIIEKPSNPEPAKTIEPVVIVEAPKEQRGIRSPRKRNVEEKTKDPLTDHVSNLEEASRISAATVTSHVDDFTESLKSICLSSHTKPPVQTATDENLEDWLDSVLGD